MKYEPEQARVHPTEIRNAIIKKTTLGYEDHGILTFWLHCEGDGWGCGFGGFALDAYDKATDRRVSTAFGAACISAVLQTLELDCWEKLPGTAVRVDTEGLGGRIRRLGHLIKDQWLDIAALAEAYDTDGKKSATGEE